MDSIREQILQALALKMGAERTLRSDTIVLYDDIAETPDEPTAGYAFVESTINVRAEYVTELTETQIGAQSTLMNNKAAEIIQLATAGDRTLGDLALNTWVLESGWQQRESGSKIVAAYAVIAIKYTYNRGDPFSNSEKP